MEKSEQRDVLVIVPTRSRPEGSVAFAEAFFAHSTRSALLFALDDDDPELTRYTGIPGAQYEVNPRLRLVGTLNLIASKYYDQYRYLAFMGDDHRIRTPGWDQLLVEAIDEVPAGIAYGNDLHQGANLPTAVLMNAAIVRTLGFMAPPDLIHSFKDNFWRDLGQRLGSLRYCNDVVIEHLHWVVGKADHDAVYQESNHPAAVARDQVAYDRYVRTRLERDVGRLTAPAHHSRRVTRTRNQLSPAPAMKTFDCLTFFNEVDVVEIRLRELAEVVDYHVIAEATTTHAGQHRELSFDLNDPRWDAFRSKIIYIPVYDMPLDAGDWDRENFQRNAILRGLDHTSSDGTKICSPDDLVLVSDADEIPRASAVRLVQDQQAHNWAKFEMSYFNYRFNQRGYIPYASDEDGTPWVRWYGTVAARRSTFEEPQQLRNLRNPQPGDLVIPDGGWHFSWLGGIEDIQLKFASMAHQEYNKPEAFDPDRITAAIEQGRDHLPNEDRWRFKIVPLDNQFPAYLLHNQDNFRGLIANATVEPTTSDVAVTETERVVDYAAKTNSSAIVEGTHRRSLKANVISFSLYGDTLTYLVGAIKNVKLAERYFPEFTCRFYYGRSVPNWVLQTLNLFDNVELVDMTHEPEGPRAMFWRFLAVSDPDVENYLCRDTDSRLCERDREAVDEWLGSGKNFHILRERPVDHNAPIVGCMWGCRAEALRDMASLIESTGPHPDCHGSDQFFLWKHVYPIAVESAMVHDELFDFEPSDFEEKRPFPTPMTYPGDWAFVAVDENDRDR